MKMPPHNLTTYKREIRDFPKLPSATSFICKPLYKIPNPAFENKKFNNLKFNLKYGYNKKY